MKNIDNGEEETHIVDPTIIGKNYFTHQFRWGSPTPPYSGTCWAVGKNDSNPPHKNDLKEVGRLIQLNSADYFIRGDFAYMQIKGEFETEEEAIQKITELEDKETK